MWEDLIVSMTGIWIRGGTAAIYLSMHGASGVRKFPVILGYV